MKIFSYYKTRHIFAGSSLSLFFNILIWLLLVWRLLPQEQQIVIHYNIYFGPDQFGPAWQAVYLPVLGLVVILVNFFVGYLFWEKMKIVSYLLGYLGLLLQLIILLAAVFLTLANI